MENELFFLGINLGFNSSACIISNRRGIIAAISEERLINEKNTRKFPINSIKYCFKEVGTNTIDVHLAFCHFEEIDLYNLVKTIPSDYLNKKDLDFLKLCKQNKFFLETHRRKCKMLSRYAEKELQNIYSCLSEVNSRLGINTVSINQINHHLAHALAVYYTSGYSKDSKCVVVTMDGFGQSESATIHQVINGEWTKLTSNASHCSVGLVYQYVTGALGFIEHQHEGKITGLAAYGDSSKYYDFFNDILYVDDTGAIIANYEHTFTDTNVIEYSLIQNFDEMNKLRSHVYTWVDKLKVGDYVPIQIMRDIAAGLQKWTEEIVIRWLKKNFLLHHIKPEEIKLCLSGGVFSNVKLNQKIHDSLKVNEILTYPAMGDEGTAVGAAMNQLLSQKENIDILNQANHVFYGSSYSNDDIQSILDKKYQQLSYSKINDKELPVVIAEAIASKKIVCRYRGRMEWGPRALGNRSIFYHCKDKGVNSWLNEQLGRTEFMPFAPICKIEYANTYFENIEGKLRSTEYMTITAKCKEEFIVRYPAATHIDNTARVQFVVKENNNELWVILDEYEKLTGERALINTSFNLHNKPIVESPETAIDSWIDSNIDCLFIENYFITRV